MMRNVPVDLPSLDFPQHLGKLDGMQKKSADINMATVPSVTYLMRKTVTCINSGLNRGLQGQVIQTSGNEQFKDKK